MVNGFDHTHAVRSFRAAIHPSPPITLTANPSAWHSTATKVDFPTPDLLRRADGRIVNHSGRIRVAAAIAGLSFLVLSGCDSAPGAGVSGGIPPSVRELSFTPSFVDVSALPPQQRTESSAQIPFSARVTVQDGDALVSEVTIVVKSLFAGEEPVFVGPMTARDGLFVANTTLSLRFAGEPPVVEAVEADPEVVQPPTTFRLIATVTDADGLDDILRVEGTTPNGSGFILFDDGASSGDEVAADGRFTATFDVPAASPGVQIFRIQAFDRVRFGNYPVAVFAVDQEGRLSNQTHGTLRFGSSEPTAGNASNVFEKEVTVQ